MIIGFTGHRDVLANEYQLAGIQLDYPDAKWIHGGAIGFDTQVQEHIERNNIEYDIYIPKYTKYPPKLAPIMRNYEIVDACDFLVACYDGRMNGGTYRTIQYALEKGKRVKYIEVVKHIKQHKGKVI